MLIGIPLIMGYHCNEKLIMVPSGKLSHNELERSTMLFMAKSTISTGPFSIAFSMFTNHHFSWENHHFSWVNHQKIMVKSRKSPEAITIVAQLQSTSTFQGFRTGDFLDDVHDISRAAAPPVQQTARRCPRISRRPGPPHSDQRHMKMVI